MKRTRLASSLAAKAEPASGAVVRVDDAATGVFERLAKDPSVDVEKLERLIAMQERVLAHRARMEFSAAFAAMQPEIPTVDEHGTLKIVKDGRVIQATPYAKNEDIQEALKPILARHGFMLSFRTKHLSAGGVLVTGILAHVGGHQETSEFEAAPDATGSKNAIQALGSARSYGRRYVTLDLLNVVSRVPVERDDDGAAANRRPDEDDGLKPAQRKSAQAPTTGRQAVQAAAASPPAESVVAAAGPAPETPTGPPTRPEPPVLVRVPVPVGRVDVLDEKAGGVVVKLDTGYVAGTRRAEFVEALRRHHRDGSVVELVTRAPSNPANAPVIEEVTVQLRPGA